MPASPPITSKTELVGSSTGHVPRGHLQGHCLRKQGRTFFQGKGVAALRETLATCSASGHTKDNHSGGDVTSDLLGASKTTWPQGVEI